MNTFYRLLFNILFWCIAFYPVYLGLHVALDYFAGSQEFYQQLAKGAYRSTFQYILRGWGYSLWLPLFFSFLSSLFLFSRNRFWSSPFVALLATGTLSLAVFFLVTPFSPLQVAPLFGAFYLSCGIRALLWRVAV